MAKEKIYIQDYEIKGSVLEIISGSGKKYELTAKSCTCKGFSFRRTCGHIEEAKEKGLLKKLTEKQGKKIQHLTKSIARVKARKDAIRKFLEKHDISFDEVTIDNMEKHLTQETTPEKILQIAMADKKAVEVLKQYGV